MTSSETIRAAVGAEFTVRLVSATSAGYVWDVDGEPAGVKLLERRVGNAPGKDAPGDPIAQVFRWQALNIGHHVIRFVLKPRWETTPTSTHIVTVEVY